jgi:integrase
MQAKRLTTTRVKTLKPKKTRYMVADGEGLYIEIHPSGAKSWRVRYRRDGRPATTNLGRWPAISLEAARTKVAQLNPSLFSGLKGTTVRDFVGRYQREVVCRARKDPTSIARYFDKNIVPVIGDKEIDKVSVADLRNIVFSKRDQGFPLVALALRDVLKRLFDYALVCGVVSANPILAIPRKLIATPHPRMRTLSRAEVGQFVCRMEQTRLKPRIKAALQLLLLTLTRKGELLLARWEHVDLGEREWSIPAELTKTRTPHIVYLSTQAAGILRSLAERYPNATPNPKHCVIPAQWSTTQPLSESTLNRALERIAGDMEPFTVHDLRRTGATLLSEAEFNADVIEKALNHVIKGVRGVYNQALYKEPRKQMLQEWADMIDDYAIEQRKACELPLKESAGPPTT